MNRIHATVWTEELTGEAALSIYPQGLHEAIGDALRADERFEVRTATHTMPQMGLTDEVLQETDVLFWWGHVHHQEVPDELVERIWTRVMAGMGIVLLHSAHYSKLFKRLTGRVCRSKWWENGDRERLFTVLPGHPIAKGVPAIFELPQEETYCEYFDIPTPDELVFLSWFSGGAVLRSGVCYHAGAGKMFYFQPGHETVPTYHDETIRRILRNAAVWAADPREAAPVFGQTEPMEEIK